MTLSELKIKNKKPADKPFKLFDERGLFLLVNPSGSKYWRFKYRFSGKEKLLAFGVYPDVSLAEARYRRDQARKLIANEVDPGVTKQIAKTSALIASANTFESVALEWYSKHIKIWAPSHSDKIIRRLKNDVFPWIGSRPVSSITPPELLTILRRVEERGALETAHRIRLYCGQIFRYSVATGRAERDITGDLRGALSPAINKSYAAIIEPHKVGELMRAINGYEGSLITRCALRLAPLVFVRPGELRHAEWSEVNIELGEWNIPAEKMKMRHIHLVPLSKQAISIFQELYPLTCRGKYIFPSIRTNERPMSENTINAALRRLGYDSKDITTHGFRATARTILDEILGFRPDVIEHQLAHAVRDPNGRAYNRTSHIEIRKVMMQRWSDYLDELAIGNKLTIISN